MKYYSRIVVCAFALLFFFRSPLAANCTCLCPAGDPFCASCQATCENNERIARGAKEMREGMARWEAETRKIKAANWYGAITENPGGVLFESHAEESRDEAVAQALKLCKSQSKAVACSVRAEFMNQCAVAVTPQVGKSLLIIGKAGAGRELAEKQAISQCEQAKGACTVSLSVCSTSDEKLAKRDREELARIQPAIDFMAKALESIFANAGTTKQLGLYKRGLPEGWEAWDRGIKTRPYVYTNAPQACSTLYDMTMDCAHKTDSPYGYDSPGSSCAPYAKLSELCVMGKDEEFNKYLSIVRSTEQGKLVYEKIGTNVSPIFVYHNVPAGTKFPVPNGPTEGLTVFSIEIAETQNKQAEQLYRASIGMGLALVGPSDLYLGVSDDFQSPWKEMIQNDVRMVRDSEPKSTTIQCRYISDKNRSLGEYLFWYKRNPDYLKTANLERVFPNHPLLRIGSAINQCPTLASEAKALVHLMSKQSIRDGYGEKVNAKRLGSESYSPDNLTQ